MEEEQLSTRESLKLINRMIYEAKGYFYESGLAAIIYGFSFMICSALAYLKDNGSISFPFHPFYLLVPVFFLQSWVQYKEDKKKKAKTFTDEAIDYVWIGFFLAAIIAACFAGGGYIMITLFLFLQGLATFITGMIAKFYYHVVCGILCFIAGGFSIYIVTPDIYLLFGVCAFITWVIPGFILNKKLRAQQKAEKPFIIE